MKHLLLIGLAILALTSCQQPQQKENQGEQSPGAENAVIENILNRRSIRAYKQKQISDEELNQLITCAINAPSARNLQPWEVRVIQKPELIDAINEGFASRTKAGKASADSRQDRPAGVFHGAPTVIVVANDTSNFYGAFDCGLLTQNILLAAETMNIGTCVVGNPIHYLNSPEAEELVAQLNLPEGYKPVVTISVGYKDQSPEARPRNAAKVQIIK